MRVLSVDDSRAVRAFIKDCVKDEEFTVEYVENGQECIEFLSSNQVDLVLLDWEMPIKNGIETLAEIRKQGLEFPVIMLTTKNSAEDIQQALSLGANEYLMKPFTKEILINKIVEFDE